LTSESIKALTQFPNIKHLSLQYNQLSTLTSLLAVLTCLPKLETIRLEGNPISEGSAAFPYFKENLLVRLHLKSLDGYLVTLDMLTEAHLVV
jgi:Leucine-rich repeat (LRR) protein